MCVHHVIGAKTSVQTYLMYETYCWCVTPNSVYRQMVIFYHLVEDLSLLVSGYICLTLWSSYVFFCLCCYSLLYDLQVPALPTPACVDFCCLRPRAYKNLTTAPSICNRSLSADFRSQFKMVFVHTVFHHELALLWPACCPFYSHFLCLVSTCSQFLHVILPTLVSVFFSAFVVLYLYMPQHLLFSFWENIPFPFLQLLVSQVLLLM